MLHSVKPVTLLPEMRRIVEFQGRVLELCIALANGKPNNQTTFKEVLGANAGVWFWDTVQRSQSSWQVYLNNLANALSNRTDDCTKILAAFNHDVRFESEFTNPNFEFLYPALANDLKPVIKTLFTQFYEYTYNTGYPEEVHGKPNFKLTRKRFIQSFEDPSANGQLRICPVCDTEISDSDKDEQIGVCDLDHFFSKEQYPFLSMHPYNLIPTCKACNQIFKRTTDILWDSNTNRLATQALLKIYHPHQKRSISDLGKLLLKNATAPQTGYQFDIQDDTNFGQERVQSAEQGYNLLSRWADRFERQPNVRQRIVTQARTQVRSRGSTPYPPGEMLATLRYLVAASQEAHYTSIWSSYIHFMENDLNEQNLFHSEYTTQPSSSSAE
jgi:hypothetical protein